MSKKKKKVGQLTVEDLRAQIKLLKRTPTDFRDMEVGGANWEKFADVTGRRKEMEVWADGLVLCLKEPNLAESMVLGTKRIRTFYYHDAYSNNGWDKQGWQTIIATCVKQEVSWLYLPEENPKVVVALNILLSRFGYTFRAMSILLSEHNGKPLGVVH